MSGKNLTAIALMVSAFFLIVAASLQRNTTQEPIEWNTAAATPQAPALHTVKLSISGTAKNFLMNIVTPDGGTQQGYVNMAKLRKSEHEGKSAIISYECKAGTFVYLSLQNQDEEGWVQIELFIDGTKTQESRTSASYGIASVSPSVP